MPEFSRRSWLGTTGALLASTTVLSGRENAKPAVGFQFCLNTSTIRLGEGNWGKPRPIVDSIAVASKAGFTAIEPWISELDEYVAGGGTLKDLAKRFADAGLAVPNAIGFAEWVVDDTERRKKGLEVAKKDMAKVLEVGGKQIAAPPTGATGGTSRRDDPKFTEPVSAMAAAERYQALLDLGKSIGVRPIVEVWGFSRSLSRLGETVLCAMECGRSGGAVLPDVYHLYKGGSDFEGLKLLASQSIGIFHVNDYPKLERGKITDQDRVFPGDGIAPLKEIFGTLKAMDYRGFLSLELFNRDYWKRDPHEVAKEGLAKLMKSVQGE